MGWFTLEKLPAPWYERLYNKLPDPDPRTDYWLLSPWNPAIVISSYIIGLFVILPIIMETYALDNDEPFQAKVKTILRSYNKIFVNVYTLYGFWVIFLIIALDYSWICERCDPAKNSNYLEYQMTLATPIFLFLKFIELFDSFLLKLGSRNATVANQSYHHVTVYLFAWMGARYLPTGNTVFYGMINSFTHVIMYHIYKNTSSDIPLSTIIICTTVPQFTLVLLHSLLSIFIPCGYPTIASASLAFYMMSFLVIYLYSYISQDDVDDKED